MNRWLWPVLLAVIGALFFIPRNQPTQAKESPVDVSSKPNLEVATLGGGCYWCIEAVYQELEGIEKVTSGFAGGKVDNPSYEAVCQGTTGHAEVVQLYFDPARISYEDIMDVFFHLHDPTTLNRQGNDVGTQYRSVIFYHDEAQHEKALAAIKKYQADYKDPIVTQIEAYTKFLPAEDYHQDYFANNPRQPYCSFVVAPKVAKVREKYQDRLKKSTH